MFLALRKQNNLNKKNYIIDIVAVFMLFVPIASVLTDAFWYITTPGSEWIGIIAPDSRRIDLLVRSISLSLAIGVTSSALGTLIALFLWRLKWVSGKIIIPIVGLLILVPSYIHAQAWVFFMDKISVILKNLYIVTFNFSGIYACWWIMVMALLPIPVCIILTVLYSMNPEHIQCALVYRKGIDCIVRVVLPQLLPAILTSCNLVLLLTINDYGIPSIFGVNVYSLHVFSEFSASNNTAKAFLSSLLLMPVSGLVAAFSYYYLKRIKYSNYIYHKVSIGKFSLPVWFVLSLLVGGILFLAQILIPIINLSLEVGSLRNAFNIIMSSLNEIQQTIFISSVSALFCLPFGYVAASRLAGNSKIKQLWWVLISVPFIIPAPLIGIGLISFSSKPFVNVVYGSVILSVLASVIRFMPIAAFIMYSTIRTLDPNLVDAASLFRPSYFRYLMKIRIPQLFPAFLASFAAVFALTAGELGATLIVVSPGKSTLTMKIYNYLHYGASDIVAALCLTILIIVAFAYVVTLISMVMGKKFLRYNGGKDE